jgi:DNA mismatch repair ATPase MutS
MGVRRCDPVVRLHPCTHKTMQPWNKEWHDKFKAESGADILLFRIGDFYEAFFDDAKWTAKSLGLTLTTRNPKGSKPEIPMTGFPYHQLDAYTAKIVSLGKRVAVCEQVEEPKPYRAEDDPNNPRNSDGTFKDSGKYKSLRAIKTMRRRWRNGG